MKRGIALLAVLVFLSCTAAGYLYTQRMQEPVTQEEKTALGKRLNQRTCCKRRNGHWGKCGNRISVLLYGRSENCGAGGTCAELSFGFESGTGTQYL